MSYQVLARKWRPQGFDEVVGQDHVTTALRNAIRSDRVPHAILLTGPRGVGKTTLARILGRCLNCDKGPTDTPCGSCPACAEITAGTSTDVQEIDAASRTSVDDVRELIEAIRYAPSPGKHKIFVVDEVHMLSTAAFNALLKTLEEPPPSSLFVFATTNPEKIPFTVVSRCQRYDLRRISAAEIAERLREMSGAEKITISDTSLLAIAREADGSLRDALTLLDQVIAFGGTEVDDDQVTELLDLIDRRVLIAILSACAAGDAAAALEACVRAADGGIDPKRLGESLLQLLRDLVVLRLAPESTELVEGSAEEIAELAALAERTELARLRRMFRALLKEQEDLAWAPQPRAVVEMAVVRLASLPAGDDVARLLARIDALEQRLAKGGVSGGASGGGSGGSGPGEPSGPSDAPPPRNVPERQFAASTDPPAPPASQPRRDARAPEARPPLEPDGERPPEPPGDGAPLVVVMDRLRAFFVKANPGLSSALDGASLVAREDDTLRISVPKDFHAQRLRDRIAVVEQVCSDFFRTPQRVAIETPAAKVTGRDEAQDSEDLRKLRQQALNHPGVTAALDVLGAEVVEIRPLSSKRGAPFSPGGAPR